MKRDLGWARIPLGAVTAVLAIIFFPQTTTSISCTSCSALSCVCSNTGPSILDYVGSGVSALVLILGVVKANHAPRTRWAPIDSKRPTGLTIVSILWILGGLYDIQGSSSDLQTFPGAPSSTQLTMTFLIVSGLALGLLSVIVATSILSRNRWSYRLGLALLLFGLAVNACEVVLFPYAAPFTLVFLAIAIIWFTVVWTYLHRPYARKFLRAGAIPEAVSADSTA